MAEATTQTIFVIKNNHGQFLEFQKYSGLRTWTDVFSDRCAFTSQFTATLYCRNLIADAVLELCCFEWFQNRSGYYLATNEVLELCCFEWFQNIIWFKYI